ncbi:NYN domain-containing protein [Lyngbya confervoides]|uniref:NYN domain-containing protein n=1 Tax=Lyngbya confervoides BDU141951 TaxID=1574623 RepID=A0ABD4T713_9CYAN|nr:NYN domain-containing protein [Lyngbya confervoides]MCM1984367.1 NYN domain-containing protein [Lyngbya confervoides BDU141951]
MLNRSKAQAGLVVAGISFGLGLGLTRNLEQAAYTSAIAVASTATGVVVSDRRSSGRDGLPPSPLDPLPLDEGQPAPQEPERQQIAIFWDYENVRVPTQGTSAPLAELLVDYAKSLGHPRLKIVYANWSGRQLGPGWRRNVTASPALNKEEVVVKALYSLGFEPIYVSMGKANSSDVKLAVDCLNAVYRDPSLQHIIIVTGDKDFIPLVNALKDLGKTVTIIGHADKVSEHLMLSADEFVSVKELWVTEHELDTPASPSQIPEQDAAPMPYEDAVGCLLEAIEAALEQGKSTRIETIGRLMRTINSRYHGATYVYTPNQQGTFTKFSAFIANVANEGKIRLETTDSGFKELFLLEENPQDESEFRSEAITAMDRQQWQTLIEQVQNILEEKGSLSFVPLLCLLSKAKQEGALAFLSHSSLRKALQQLIEIQLLVKEDEKLFRLQAGAIANTDQYLDQLVQLNEDQ